MISGLPTVRLNLNRHERSVLLLGLRFLASALSGPLQGYFTQARLTLATMPLGTALDGTPEFDRELAIVVQSLRIIIETLHSDKVRLDLAQLTLSEFSVRVARRQDSSMKTPRTKMILNKLEKYRKRALRKTITRLGDAESVQLKRRCSTFQRWCRLFVLEFRLVRLDHPSGSRLHDRDLNTQLRLLAFEMLRERTSTIVPTKDIARIVKLAVAEIRRDRHPFTLMSLVHNPIDAKDFLFDFFSKRLKLVPSISVARQALKPCAAATSDTSHTGDRAPNDTRASHVVSEREVYEAAKLFFLRHVPRDLRAQVKEEAILQVVHYRYVNVKPPSANTVLELINNCRPDRVADSTWEQLNLLVQWLLDWVTSFIKDPFRICNVVEFGFARANNAAL